MKLFNKAAYTGAAGYPGTTAMTQRTLLWEALQTAGLTDQNRTTVTATSTLTVAQCGLLMGNVSGASIVSTLPVAATAVDDAVYLLKRLDTSANSWTIAAGAANTIEGQASVTVPPGGILGIQLPGGSTDWKIIGAAGSPGLLVTGGTLIAYTLTPPTPITAYVRGLQFRVSFTIASGASPTLAISAVAAPPNLVALQSDGAFANITAGQIPAGHITDVILLSASQVLVVTMPPAAAAQHFSKADSQSVAFTKTGAGTAQIKAGTRVEAGGALLTFAAATAIVMPALTAGTDYAIYACTDGTVRADANFSAPTGYTTANSRKIGGLHYAPGGHSGLSGGGNATPQINEYSFWDLKFKPACLDPRGMTLVADGFWADIYLLGVEHLVNGTSKFNVTIADGASPPKVPAKFGGNGTTAYTSLNWWEAGEVAAHHGKRLPNYTEFAALAFGTTEASSIGADPVSTTWAAAYISRWGCAQASGNLWVWGANFGGGAAGAAWTANTVGRGSTYQMENAAIFGGAWAETSNSGSRASVWNISPTGSGSHISGRCVSDLLILE